MYIHQIRATILQVIRAIIQPNRYLRTSDVKYESNITNNAFNGTVSLFSMPTTFLPFYVRSLNIPTGQLA